MLKEVIETGKTVDAAIEAACLKLGYNREDCEWEILDLPKKGFLGLKFIPAKVRVSIDIPEKETAKTQQTQTSAPAVHKQASVSKNERPQPQKKKETEQKKEIPSQSVAKPIREEQNHAGVDEKESLERVEITSGFTEKEILVKSYVEDIIRDFGITASIKLYRDVNSLYVNVSGDGIGAVIGRRGETLDAIQYLAGLATNRIEGDYLRVTVDCGDYRNKRKETLEALARKLSAQVLKTNVNKALEPMNPFERRVIHATVSTIEGVSSSSIGEEPNRRVIITTPTARRAPSRGGYNRNGGQSRQSERSFGADSEKRSYSQRDQRGTRNERSGNRGGRYSDDRKRGPRPATSAPAQSGPPKETPEATAMGSTPYGKLDLE